MYLYRQKGRNIWSVKTYIKGTGKCKTVNLGTSDRIEAEAIAATLGLAVAGRVTTVERLVACLEAITGRPLNRVGIPLTKAWDTYLSTPNLRISKSQQNKTRRHWKRFCEWLKSAKPEATLLNDVTNDLATRWIISLKRTGVKAKTVNLARDDVSTIFNTLLQRSEMQVNPFAGVKRIHEDDSVKGRSFTDDEVTRLLDAADGDWHGAILIGLYTGLREGDIANLRWDSIKAGKICLSPKKTMRHGVTVTIPLHPRLKAFFEGREQNGEYVLPELHDRYSRRASEADFTKILETAKIVAGEGNYVSFHSLRHTFISRLADAGTPQSVIQRLSGHSSFAMSSRYNHSTEQEEQAVGRLK